MKITLDLGTKLKSKDDFLLVKLAGGSAAQTLALMNAIYLRNKNVKDFKLKYYPYSTGTYWPFAIDFLLENYELLDSNSPTKGLEDTSNLAVGKIIRTHPLAAKKFSYEKLLSIIRRLKLEEPLQRFRGERALIASVSKLKAVSKRVRAVSGGFVPILDPEVHSEMNQRFLRSGKKSPFSRDNAEFQVDVVIHFRIGDKRAKFTHPSDFGGDGITDPQVFKRVLDSLGNPGIKEIYVVSDEPKIARTLLAEVEIEAKLNPIQGDIWEDLFLMSQAQVFIGSWSQVSQLAAVCVVGNGGKSYLPATTQVGTKVNWGVPGIEFYEPIFLESSHSIYKPEFDLDSTAHKSYKKLT